MVKVSTKFSQAQLSNQLRMDTVEKLCERLQVYLAFPYGGLRLAPIKPVGLSGLSPIGMIVPFRRWYYG